MSKIQQELAKVTEVEPKRGEEINDQAYMKRLIVAVGKLSDSAWNKLTEPAQDWFNAATDLVNVGKSAPDFPDAEKPKDEPTTRRRRASADDEEPAAAEAKAYTPAKGHKVKVITKRGKEYAGTVLDPDDKGELVLEVGDDEIGIELDRIESVARTDVSEADKSEGRRRKDSEDDEPEVNEPEVGDTVEVKTKRGKTLVGNVIEIDKATLVIKTAAGEEEEFDQERLESVVVKVKNAGRKSSKPDDDAAPSRRRASADDDEPKKGRVTKGDNDGVPVTMRAREMICDDLQISKDDLCKKLKKEGLEFKENTISLIHADCARMFKLLRERKMLK